MPKITHVIHDAGPGGICAAGESAAAAWADLIRQIGPDVERRGLSCVPVDLGLSRAATAAADKAGTA